MNALAEEGVARSARRSPRDRGRSEVRAGGKLPHGNNIVQRTIKANYFLRRSSRISRRACTESLRLDASLLSTVVLSGAH